ncbi:proteasome activator [Actinomadura rudentiformis]|uniref:Bacterial proteasome activator n=1 Tax=Actinomadura rudentiformis TaxID=359158 RepID=A0A6H9YNI7_9ACTN|nr:proteasome activator [Actinomadura rudentiformis]KAB2342199.1 DUF2587 domain-containing protein [Actinomadura rudentiformis]
MAAHERSRSGSADGPAQWPGQWSTRQAAKLTRIGSLVATALAELRELPPQQPEDVRVRLLLAHQRALDELAAVVGAELHSELRVLRMNLGPAPPTIAELRIAHAQLHGWMEGLITGQQTAAPRLRRRRVRRGTARTRPRRGARRPT